MKYIKKLIKDLSWHKTQDIQQNAIRELLKLTENEAVLLAQQNNDLCNKPCWHNAAIVLKTIGYPRNRLALPYLMEWLRDVNWPGVLTVIELLKEIDKDIVLPYITVAMEQILKENDDFWAYGLVICINELGIKKSDIYEEELYTKLVALSRME